MTFLQLGILQYQMALRSNKQEKSNADRGGLPKAVKGFERQKCGQRISHGSYAAADHGIS